MRKHVIPGVLHPTSWPTTWEGTHEVVILEFINPTNFTYTTTAKYQELCAFEEQLCEDLFKYQGGARISFSLGNLYAVANGNIAYRAKLIKIEDHEATLKLIDRGITMMHPADELKRLPHEYASTPCFSTKAYITNIKPIIGNRWGKTCCQSYQKRLVDKKAHIHIISEHPDLEGHEVQLYAVSNQINVSEHLILNQHAIRGRYNYSLIDDMNWEADEEEAAPGA